MRPAAADRLEPPSRCSGSEIVSEGTTPAGDRAISAQRAPIQPPRDNSAERPRRDLRHTRGATTPTRQLAGDTHRARPPSPRGDRDEIPHRRVQLPRRIVAPTHHNAIDPQPARMRTARRHRRERPTRRIQPPTLAVSPTRNRAINTHPTRMRPTRRNRHKHAAGRVRLPAAVVAPAHRRATAVQRAYVLPAHRHRHEPTAVDRRRPWTRPGRSPIPRAGSRHSRRHSVLGIGIPDNRDTRRHHQQQQRYDPAACCPSHLARPSSFPPPSPRSPSGISRPPRRRVSLPLGAAAPVLGTWTARVAEQFSADGRTPSPRGARGGLAEGAGIPDAPPPQGRRRTAV